MSVTHAGVGGDSASAAPRSGQPATAAADAFTHAPVRLPPFSDDGPDLVSGPAPEQRGEAGGMAARPRGTRIVMGVLLSLVAVAVSVILMSPVALSSRDLLDWASTASGLDLPDRWPVLVILSLDAPAVAFVLMSVLCTWRGERPGIFAALIWAFSSASAFANWRHATRPGAAPDADWFYPAMSLTGPGILEAVLHRARAWMRTDRTPDGHRTNLQPRPPWARWIPWFGSFTDTLGATRTRLLLGLGTFAEALTEYHNLCPDGSLRVGTALRRRQQAQAQAHILATLRSNQPSGAGASEKPLSIGAFERLPIDPDAYQHAQTIWAELQETENSDGDLKGKRLREFTTRHQISTRQLQFIRLWGAAGMLDYPISPRVISELMNTRPPPVEAPELD